MNKFVLRMESGLQLMERLLRIDSCADNPIRTLIMLFLTLLVTPIGFNGRRGPGPRDLRLGTPSQIFADTVTGTIHTTTMPRMLPGCETYL